MCVYNRFEVYCNKSALAPPRSVYIRYFVHIVDPPFQVGKNAQLVNFWI